ncbi:MAG TPA: type II toxin-antitoxin system MqsA family antitoxin [Planctomycetota bacterium]|nr:type II toxin-antitoxin system MqsA family antitoxin [Planctomycetota bacterium]
MDRQSVFCPICGGNKIPGTATFSADLGSGVVVVRDVQASICSQCGEEWIVNATARKLESMVNSERRK